MKNHANPDVGIFAGIDVSAREISVARLQRGEENPTLATFANHASGHKALISFLLRGSERVRVCLEASGNYSLDLALALHAQQRVEVSVINPRRARRFAESLGERSKTDPVDTRVLCQYAARMPWEAWQPPSLPALRLRAITRAIESLGIMHTQESNRAHALAAARLFPHWYCGKGSAISAILRSACNCCAAKPAVSLHAIPSWSAAID
jgi:transposase